MWRIVYVVVFGLGIEASACERKARRGAQPH